MLSAARCKIYDRSPKGHFFGIRDLGGISRIKMSIGSRDWELDHLPYGGPMASQAEPASALLLAIGALGVGGLRQRIGG